MKKILITAVVAAMAAGAFARPHHGGPGPRFGHRPPPVMHHRSHHHGHHSGGRFWGGFVGGLVGSAIYDAFTPSTVVVSPTVVATPTVVTAPTVVSTTRVISAPVTTVQNVWVEGRYVDQVQANGTVIRVWQPGHYEQMSVVVQ
ncbi:MAG: hypothetical protein ILO34_00825 [Kiritimatiellae bacterium]|nr:hypothetical protein [Kiritimatiellia bacterium]